MKIHIKLRKRLEAGRGVKLDDSDENTLVSAAADLSDIEDRLAAAESSISSHASSISSLNSAVGTLESTLAGYGDVEAVVCPAGTVTILAK